MWTRVIATMRARGRTKGEDFFCKGKCELIANFSVTVVTSFLSVSLSSCAPYTPYAKRFCAWYNESKQYRKLLEIEKSVYVRLFKVINTT